MNLAKYSLDNTKVIYFFLAVLLLGGISPLAIWERKKMHRLSSNQPSS